MNISVAERFNNIIIKSRIDQIDQDTERMARELFGQYSKMSVIIGNYDDTYWKFSDGVHPQKTIKFDFDDISLRAASQLLGCKSYDLLSTAKQIVALSLGRKVIKSLVNIMSSIRNLIYAVAEKAEKINTNYEAAQYMLAFLELLPHDSDYRNLIIDSLMYCEMQKSSQRTLSNFQSYLRFDKIIREYWDSATTTEKLYYFPLYIWWMITNIIPCRPTAFAITPRNFPKPMNGKYFISLRRSKLKGGTHPVAYTMQNDYEITSYPITAELYSELQWYIDNTTPTSEDVLFQPDIYYKRQSNPIGDECRSGHYTYGMLNKTLQSFYRNIVIERYQMTIADTNINHKQLSNNEIEYISLGDTRHLSMINLVVNGTPPEICSVLAGHTDIDISSNYYSNISKYTEALALETAYNPKYTIVDNKYDVADRTNMFPTNDGYCASSHYQQQDYSDCFAAVSKNGNVGSCHDCKHFYPNKPGVSIKKSCEDHISNLKNDTDLLVQFIDIVRANKGQTELLQKVLDSLQADVAHYYRHLRLAKGEVIQDD